MYTSRIPKSDKLLTSVGVDRKNFPSEEPECLRIFQSQTLTLRPWACLQKIHWRWGEFFQTTPVAYQQFVLDCTHGESVPVRLGSATLEEYLDVSSDLGRLQKGSFVSFLVQCL